jgi:hypothetical protein
MRPSPVNRNVNQEKYKTWIANDSNAQSISNWERTQEKVFTSEFPFLKITLLTLDRMD